jgi:ADP-ribosyl-[dinitrogen reductase] hydrolase
MTDRADAAAGCLLGAAVGDARGLRWEGMSRRRQKRMNAYLGEAALLADGRNMCSDDTDHACMVAQALSVSAGSPRRFISSLAWRLRFWLLGLPAGIGWGTLRAILKLWLFVPPQFSGVRSAGNGPAMRSAILGVAFSESDPLLVMHVSACSAITHSDPRAQFGALAVALAARSAMRGEIAEEYLFHLERFAAPFGDAGKEMVDLAQRAVASAEAGEPTLAFAASIGCERAVSGYIFHTVPVALHAWRRNAGNLETAIDEVVGCGGDTDTVAAIVGGIVGAGVGRAGIPESHLARLWDWPRGARWIEDAARNALAAADTRVPRAQLYISPFKLLGRNLVFLAVVLTHGFRRLLPPY